MVSGLTIYFIYNTLFKINKTLECSHFQKRIKMKQKKKINHNFNHFHSPGKNKKKIQ